MAVNYLVSNKNGCQLLSLGLISGNFIAVGNLDSEISVWDIDVLNTIDPVFTLGVPKVFTFSSPNRIVLK